MKRAEILGWVTVVGLALATAVLMVMGTMFGAIIFWAAGMAALAQTVLVGLVLWGLILTRQQDELQEGPPLVGASTAAKPQGPVLGGFRMSYGDDEPVQAKSEAAPAGPGAVKVRGPEVRTLEPGFQRVVVAVAVGGLVLLAGIIAYLIYGNLRQVEPGKPLALPVLNELALVMGLAGTLGFGVLWLMLGNYRAGLRGAGAAGVEAMRGLLGMLLPGMVLAALAVVAGYFQVGYAAEAASAILAALLLLQALELAVNAARKYTAIEEFDQEPIDLLATPLVPMLTSFWMAGLRTLVAQSLGLERVQLGVERGIVARMMPRVLIALVLLIGLMTTVRVVEPGEVAIRERLGHASESDIKNPLQPGLHFMLPWPIDQLVHIPTGRLQPVTVGGVEEEPETVTYTQPDGRTVTVTLNWLFWQQHTKEKAVFEQDMITGDQPAQLLGTIVTLWWRVRPGRLDPNDPTSDTGPTAFYRNLSHDDFLTQEIVTENGTAKEKTVARPIYEALVEAAAQDAVIAAFARHSLENVMESGRGAAQKDCRRFLQNRLDHLFQKDGKWFDSGIEIVDLTIKDVHPPVGEFWIRPVPNGEIHGPAAAYEYVVRMREFREEQIDQAEAEKIRKVKEAEGEAASLLGQARSYAAQRIAEAHVEVERRVTVGKEFSAHRDIGRLWMQYRALEEVLPGVTKILYAPGVSPPHVWMPPKDNKNFLMPGLPPSAPGP